MLFYANSLINPIPYTIPLPLTSERGISFWRYGVRCFISVFLREDEQCGDDVIQLLIRPAGFPLLCVTIYAIHFVAAKVIGNTETDGMGMNVVSSIDTIVII